VDDEAPSSSAAAAGGVYDLSAPYLSVRIRCRKEDAVSYSVPRLHLLFSFHQSFCLTKVSCGVAIQDLLSESLLCFGACSVTVDDIADAANLDEVNTIFSVHFAILQPDLVKIVTIVHGLLATDEARDLVKSI
jgi:hypothetical protein